MRVLKKSLLYVAGFYLLMCGLLFITQEHLIFHPRERPADFSYGGFPEHFIEVEDGISLNGVFVPAIPGDTAEQVVLYLHGNVGDNGRSLHQTRSFRDLGADLFLVDYRGFGKSGGEIDGERTMTEDLEVVYHQLAETYGEENVIITGYSLGTGPTTYLASRNNPKGIVLIAPYTSLVDMKNRYLWMFPDLLMGYELNSKDYLAKSNCPATILHGTDDDLIPFQMGETLAAIDAERINLIPMNGVGHRGAILQPVVGRAVAELLLN
ncbi:alpha/beta hydrolase [Lewinella sp. 4G2]|uniref:alpha/beta hydrolase n=1 Tax=Lewinella sp. 4G2 TaxID=1803372 RepID=UPI0007B4F4B5|nr:alpha/beta hydrolase [Lewinella sp. 4G2]OAV45511.1 hypothetical protein A3850_013880 [Lewinella sp. 4G2]